MPKSGRQRPQYPATCELCGMVKWPKRVSRRSYSFVWRRHGDGSRCWGHSRAAWRAFRAERTIKPRPPRPPRGDKRRPSKPGRR